jgi:fumarylpyruvate hydrolase
MSDRVLPPIPVTGVPVSGGGFFPVRRFYCVGRDFLDHIPEMKRMSNPPP